MKTARRNAYMDALGLGGGWALRRPTPVGEPGARVSAASDREDTGIAPGATLSPGFSTSIATADSAARGDPNGPDPAGGPLAPAAAPGALPTAVSAAGSAAAFSALQARVAACTRCALHTTRTQTVFGVGNIHADWLIVGEAPGAEEDRQGEPFVGRAGQLLNSMLRAIGLRRDQVYIANVLKCRPPGNRDPAGVEVAECMPYLEGQIALLKPKIMLAVGRIAAQNLLHTNEPLARLRRRIHAFGEHRVPLVATYHPAYLLRTPADKRKAWEDLKFACEALSRV